MRRLGALSNRLILKGLPAHRREQDALRQRYGIEGSTPIRGYDEALRAEVRAVSGAVLAQTSGSTNAPKEIAYTPKRVRGVKKLFVASTLRTVAARKSQRPVVFTLASIADDASFTALMTQGDLSRVDCLLTPHRILSHRALAPLIKRYGLNALRVWAMVLSCPGWLYSTNPSTQAVFFQGLENDWHSHLSMLRDFRADPAVFGGAVIRLASRIVSTGWDARADALLQATEPLRPREWLTRLELFSSWDGGNTQAFVHEVSDRLEGLPFMPMFSMSTETVQTLPVMDESGLKFLPIVPGVLYEFLPEGAPDRPECLLPAHALVEGQAYCLVCSDAFGLRRYQTDDVFLASPGVGGVPDLRFLRRRGLAFSFTGEKLTGAQVEMAYGELAERHPELRSVQFTTLPSRGVGERLPRYDLVLAAPGRDASINAEAARGLAAEFDERLQSINEEYSAKRQSGRLAPPIFEVIHYDALAAALRGKDEAVARGWDSQFKLLPLVPRLRQELRL